MRELKFRAWDKENNLLLKDSDIEEWTLHNMSDWYEEYEIMQYTGIKDKNGKEIYEGDIVKYAIEGWYGQPDYTINRVVEYTEGHYEPFVHGYEEFTQRTYPESCEVIGNIYENNELVTKV